MSTVQPFDVNFVDRLYPEEKQLGPLTVVHRVEATAGLVLAHRIDFHKAFQLLPDTLTHCHRSIQNLEAYRANAFKGDKLDVACFMLKVCNTTNEVKVCHHALTTGIQCAQMKLKLLKEIDFEKEQGVLEKEQETVEQNCVAFLERWNSMAAANNKRYPKFMQGGKKHTAMAQEFVKSLESACVPYHSNIEDVKKRIRELNDKKKEIQRLEQVVFFAIKELQSHLELTNYLAKQLKETPLENFEEDAAVEEKEQKTVEKTEPVFTEEELEALLLSIRLNKDDKGKEELYP